MLGIINAKTISKGRYGRTREIVLSINEPSITNIRKLLEKELGVL
jgi:Cdc6-like AAA superfamily ATPase